MKSRLIDLTHPLNRDTPLFPGDTPLSLNQTKTSAADGYNAFHLSTGLHTGTHVDASLHLQPEGRMVSAYPPENFCGRGVLLDVRGQPRVGRRPEYDALVSRGDAVLLYTGFNVYFHTDPERYFSAYPTLDDGLCDFFCQKGITLLGMDTPSPDYPPFDLHVKLLTHNICLLENLTNLKELCGLSCFTVMALPLPIDAEASPVRAVAITT